MNATLARPRLIVTVDDTDMVNHARSRLVAEMTSYTGQTAGLSGAMASTNKRRRGLDCQGPIVSTSATCGRWATPTRLATR